MDKFAQLKNEFLQETEETLGELQRDLDAIRSAAECPAAEVLGRAFRATHSLKGSAGMFGLDLLSGVAHAMESILEDLRDAEEAVAPETVDLLDQGHELLWSLVAGESRGDAAPDSRAEAYIRDARERSAAAAPSAQQVVDALHETTHDIRLRLAEASLAGQTVALVVASPERPADDLRAAILDWGELCAELPPSADDPCLRWFAVSSDSLFGLLKRVAPLGAEAYGDEFDAAVRLAQELAPEAAASSEARSEAPPEEPLAAAPKAPPVAAPEAPPAATVETSPETPAEVRAEADSGLDVARTRPAAVTRTAFLRVPLERVDKLMGDLGDLMQAKLGLDNAAEEILEAAPHRVARTQARQSLRALDRRIRQLQDRVLEVRMVSIEPIFQKAERTLRETCRQVGKSAELVTHGSRLELDKGVADALTEPLAHLIRNAVDHGLETPEERRRAGKPEAGTIRLAAYADGTWTVVEIADDGAGVDFERVAAKAKERGLFAADARPAESDLLEVLFHPGFSVRDAATEVSGRGVGLDAVRRALQAIGGQLDCESDTRGTTFRLRLPGSLAMAQALEVELGPEAYFLPLTNVTAVGSIAPSALERLGADEVCLDGPTARRVFDLASLFGLPPVPRDRERIPAVTLRARSESVVFLVDRLGRRKDIVVRPLGLLLPPVAGIVGSTERGDGRTVLLLDPLARVPAGGGSLTREVAP